MKAEIDAPGKIAAWLAKPVPAIFQGQDLRGDSTRIAESPLGDCAFLGCAMETVLETAAAAAGCLVMPRMRGLPFDPFAPCLYSPDTLYDKFDPNAADPATTYHQCLDWLIYESFVDPETRIERPVDLDVILMRRIHDSSIADALDDLLDTVGRARCVAIMGGHDRGRDEPVYAETARLALDLTQQGYFVVTGGGPGLMEAGNLGAFAAGFSKPLVVLDAALEELRKAPLYSHKNWLVHGFRAWKGMGTPAEPARSRNLGVPTWFYGFEPPNVFATEIAKYFENSVREEGLLALAQGGVIYAEGSGGTVQEIFQDANQNYYRSIAKTKSPMVLFNKAFWNPSAMNFNDPSDKAKQAYLLLHKLATDKRFDDYVLLSDEPDAVVKFIKTHPPVG